MRPSQHDAVRSLHPRLEGFVAIPVADLPRRRVDLDPAQAEGRLVRQLDGLQALPIEKPVRHAADPAKLDRT